GEVSFSFFSSYVFARILILGKRIFYLQGNSTIRIVKSPLILSLFIICFNQHLFRPPVYQFAPRIGKPGTPLVEYLKHYSLSFTGSIYKCLPRPYKRKKIMFQILFLYRIIKRDFISTPADIISRADSHITEEYQKVAIRADIKIEDFVIQLLFVGLI